MKKILLTLTFAMSLFANLFAQNSKGHVIYDVEVSSDDPQMEQIIPMLAGSTFEMYFTDNNSLTNLNIGSFMTTSIITDIKEDKVLLLMSGMMGKMAIQDTISNFEKDSEGEVESEESEEVEYEIEFTNETKEIQGFECKKAILTNENGMELIYWYTEEIQFSKDGQKYFNKDVPGFPMEFETFNGGMKLTMTVKEYSDTFDKEEKVLFDLTIPEGYTEMTADELVKMGQGE